MPFWRLTEFKFLKVFKFLISKNLKLSFKIHSCELLWEIFILTQYIQYKKLMLIFFISLLTFIAMDLFCCLPFVSKIFFSYTVNYELLKLQKNPKKKIWSILKTFCEWKIMRKISIQVKFLIHPKSFLWLLFLSCYASLTKKNFLFGNSLNCFLNLL